MSLVVNVLTTRENDLLEICKRDRELSGASLRHAVVANDINLFKILMKITKNEQINHSDEGHSLLAS